MTDAMRTMGQVKGVRVSVQGSGKFETDQDRFGAWENWRKFDGLLSLGLWAVLWACRGGGVEM